MKRVLLTITFEFKTLDQLVPLNATREDAVYWFLSLLELMRLGQVQARLIGNEVEFGRA
jgi:chromatin segregation and condensation protein Rec8/ScpA/Scc1 (kleisin family)